MVPVSVSVLPGAFSVRPVLFVGPSATTPEKVDDGPSFVRMASAAPLLVAVPPPASELTVCLKPPRSRKPPLSTVVALLGLNAFVAPPSIVAPLFTAVAPV